MLGLLFLLLPLRRNFEKMWKIFFLCAVFLYAGMLLLSVRVLLKKDGRFRSLHIGQSKAMRDRGIHCVQAQDFEARIPNPMAVNESARASSDKESE